MGSRNGTWSIGAPMRRDGSLSEKGSFTSATVVSLPTEGQLFAAI